MTGFKLPRDKDLATEVINSSSQLDAKRLDIGWIGKCFGSSSEKPGNIVAIVIVFSILIVVITLFSQVDSSTKREISTIFGGIITASLGYLFGKSTN
jgi:hypothetical protein